MSKHIYFSHIHEGIITHIIFSQDTLLDKDLFIESLIKITVYYNSAYIK